MSDYHVHYHVNIINIPGASNEDIIINEVFPHIVTSDKTETQQVQNPDGSTTFVYTEARMDVQKAKELSEKYTDLPIILLSHGHEGPYDERSALVLHGGNGKFEVTTVSVGTAEDAVREAMLDGDFLAGQQV